MEKANTAPLSEQEIQETQPAERPIRKRTQEELWDALRRFCRRESVMSIPVNEDRDADCIIGDGIRELLALRSENEQQAATIKELQQQSTLKDQLVATTYSEVRWAKQEDAPGGICKECGHLVPRLVKLYEFGPNYHLKLHDHICQECCQRIGSKIEARNNHQGPTGAPEQQTPR